MPLILLHRLQDIIPNFVEHRSDRLIRTYPHLLSKTRGVIMTGGYPRGNRAGQQNLQHLSAEMADLIRYGRHAEPLNAVSNRHESRDHRGHRSRQTGYGRPSDQNPRAINHAQLYGPLSTAEAEAARINGLKAEIRRNCPSSVLSYCLPIQIKELTEKQTQLEEPLMSALPLLVHG